jgi:hypothetical protein
MTDTQDGFQYMSRKEAAAYLTKNGYPIAPNTLASMAKNRNAGGGPPFIKFGWRTCRYRRDELDSWMRKRGERVK